MLAAIVLVVVLVIGLIRLLDVYAFAGHEWLSYVVVGVALTARGNDYLAQTPARQTEEVMPEHTRVLISARVQPGSRPPSTAPEPN